MMLPGFLNTFTSKFVTKPMTKREYNKVIVTSLTSLK